MDKPNRQEVQDIINESPEEDYSDDIVDDTDTSPLYMRKNVGTMCFVFEEEDLV